MVSGFLVQKKLGLDDRWISRVPFDQAIESLLRFDEFAGVNQLIDIVDLIGQLGRQLFNDQRGSSTALFIFTASLVEFLLSVPFASLSSLGHISILVGMRRVFMDAARATNF